MTTLTDAEVDGTTTNPWPIVDCDVHEMFRSPHDLLPYLDEPWAHYVRTGWAPYFFSYAYPTDAGFARVDAVPEGEGPAGSDYDLMRTQLLDEFDVSIAILTSLFFPSDNNVQFELSTALARAYNEWVADNWLTRDDRFRGSMCVNVNDPQGAVEEIHRVAERDQVIQIMLPPRSDSGYGEIRYRPILEAAVETGLPIALHPSAAVKTALGYPPYLIEWRTCSVVQHAMSQVVSLVVSGVFERWPSLKVTIVEGGWSWVPHLMWRLDMNYRQLRQEVPWLKDMPSDIIRRHFRFTTQPVETLKTKHFLQIIEQMESDELLLFSSDYPHFDFDSPYRALKQLPSSLIRKIQHENPARWYGFNGLLDESAGAA